MAVDFSKLIGLDELTVFKNKADQLYATQTTTSGLDSRITALEEVGSDDNTIETVKVNGTALTPDSNKAVNITVPTKTSDLTNDDNVVKDASYVHTDNNYDDAAVSKLAGIAAGAQVNVIEDITVGGTSASVVSKTVALGTAATATTETTLTDGNNLPTGSAVKTFVEGKGYQTSSQVTSAIEGYGYQTASQVETTVESYGYQTASDVASALTNSGFQENVIETVKVNGTALTPASKAVDVTITAGDSGVGTFKVNGTNVTAYGLGSAAGATVETTGISSDTTTLPTTAQVKSYVDSHITSAYKAAGSLAGTGVVSTLLVAANEGNVYNLSTALTLDATSAALFVDGTAGDVITAGTNIVVVNAGSGAYKFDKMAGFVDLSGYVLASSLGLASTSEINALFA